MYKGSRFTVNEMDDLNKLIEQADQRMCVEKRNGKSAYLGRNMTFYIETYR